jgi:hypothetical protein
LTHDHLLGVVQGLEDLRVQGVVSDQLATVDPQVDSAGLEGVP